MFPQLDGGHPDDHRRGDSEVCKGGLTWAER